MFGRILIQPWLLDRARRELPAADAPNPLFGGMRIEANAYLPKTTPCSACRGSGVGPLYSDCAKCGGSGRFHLLGVATYPGLRPSLTLIVGEALPFTPAPRWPADWPVETPRRINRVDQDSPPT